MMYVIGIVALLALVNSIVLVLTSGCHLRESITQIIEKLNEFILGDFNVNLELNLKDEFGEVARSFNHMT